LLGRQGQTLILQCQQKKYLELLKFPENTKYVQLSYGNSLLKMMMISDKRQWERFLLLPYLKHLTAP
jgi:hypothetical protein